MLPPQTNLVHIAVPVEYVGHIARLIEDLDRVARPLPRPSQRTRGAAVTGREWPVRELRRFAQGRSRTHQTVAAILDLLAVRPGQRLPVGDIAAELGMSVEKVIGALGGLTRIVKAYHDYPTYGLPLQRITDSAGGRSAVVSYALSAEQARRWRIVREQG
ncbi:hypothetical protein [Micromonospora endolithica]|uniref:hypothetical protein n=1 Tax=Micromonospora endolithica TaxID=230091 RepID=UPI0011BF860C|nr:hypothetical protein [Micromonospora endolithica]